ncbi:MAG: hypothetical protein M1357_02640 [Candidatus Marsarchaeota archaeon]|nr:hypothetical protein [Candidatus Marsarchaeota archaeon]
MESSESSRSNLGLVRKVVKYIALAGAALLFASSGVDEYITLQPSSNGFVPAWVPVGVVLGLLISGFALLALIMLPSPPRKGGSAP